MVPTSRCSASAPTATPRRSSRDGRPCTSAARWVVADEIDGHGTWRITLTPLCLNAAATAAFVVAGAAKADVVRRVIEGVVAPDVLPAQAITPRRRLIWLLDAAAAGLRAGSWPRAMSAEGGS